MIEDLAHNTPIPDEARAEIERLRRCVSALPRRPWG